MLGPIRIRFFTLMFDVWPWTCSCFLEPWQNRLLQRITFSWWILTSIPTCTYVSNFGNRTPSPHHSPLLLLPNVPFEMPVSCSSPASNVLWSIIHSFISLFLPRRLYNCKVSELHSESSILGFRHVYFPDRMRFGPVTQSNTATSDNHQFHSIPKSQTFPTERTQNT